MAERNIFGNTQEERNIYFTRAVPYLNQPAVGTTPSNATRLGITAANLAILNKLYSNPNPPGVTVPDTLGYLELWVLHTSPGGKHDPTITKLFNAIERQHQITDPIGLENQLRLIYGDIPQSALTATDRTALNLQTRKAKTTTSISTEQTGRLIPTKGCERSHAVYDNTSSQPNYHTCQQYFFIRRRYETRHLYPKLYRGRRRHGSPVCNAGKKYQRDIKQLYQSV